MSDFLQKLTEKTGKRVVIPYVLYWQCYIDSSPFPEECSKKELLVMLHALESEDKLKIIRSSKEDWIPGNPDMPAKIRLIREKQIKPKTQTLWHPKLHFMYQESNPATIESAKPINAYLKARAIDTPMIAQKERSLKIFGDEKRLDSLIGKSIIFEHISLEDLDCYTVSIPLISCQEETRSNDLIVIENLSTYDTFCRFNRRSKRFFEVVYGWGRNASRQDMVQALCERMQYQQDGTIYYFGDIDPAGINIAIDLKTGIQKYAPDIRFDLMHQLYQFLLDHGVRKGSDFKAEALRDNVLAMELCDGYFPEIESLFSSKNRIPQESLTGVELAQLLSASVQANRLCSA